MLLTPSLTGLLNDGNSLISDIVHQAFGQNQRFLELDVLAGVVDRISYPPDTFHPESVLVGRNLPPGSEGLSIFITTSAAPSLWPFIPRPSPRFVASAKLTTGKPGCVLPTTYGALWNFDIDTPNFLSVSKLNQKDDSQLQEQRAIVSFHFVPRHSIDKRPAVLHTVELPLANTLFHNGRLSTLIAQRWVQRPQTGSSSRLVRVKQKFLQGQIGVVIQEQGNRPPSIQLPRSWSLTPPRVIAESMGNIIRKVKLGESTIPASKELEESIAIWTNRSDLDYEIWAQIVPSERWLGPPQSLGNPAEVGQGSRLHRVLGGGGGWGSKQGLISLDPESGFAPIHEQDIFGDGQDLETEQRKALGEVARPGDVVHFLAFLLDKPPKLTQLSFSIKILDQHSITLGSIRSREDEAVEHIQERNTKSAQADYTIIHGHFGAMSETGISLHIQTIEHGSTDYGAHETNTVVRTKLPPLASLTWTRK